MKKLILIIINDIANTDAFKSFKYKTELLGKIPAEDNNGIKKNAVIAVPLKYLSNFWRLIEMPLISFKLELKFRWTKHCILSASPNDTDNHNIDFNDIIFTMKDTKVYVLVVTLSAKDNQKLPKILSKRFERSVYWN